MEWNKLEAKYWQGNTTLEEEAALRKAALAGEPALSAVLVSAIKSIDTAGNAKLDQGFEADFWAQAEAADSGPQSDDLVFKLASFMRYAAAAAIVVALGLTVFHLLKSNEEMPAPVATMEAVDTYSDPEEAFQAAAEALGIASAKLNEAQQPVKEIRRFHQSKAAITGMNPD